MQISKFEEYITESNSDPYEIVKAIYTYCMPFVKEYSRISLDKNITTAPPMLYSGRKKNDAIFKGTVRKNRIPLSTPEHMHNFVDDIFYELFKVRSRSNAIFCINDYLVAKGYGYIAYAIFPIGNYTIVWSPKYADLYQDILEGGGYDFVGEGKYESDYIGNYIDQTSIGIDIDYRLRKKFDKDHNVSDYQDVNEYEFEKERYIDKHFENMFHEEREEIMDRLKVEHETALYDLIQRHYQSGNLEKALKSRNEIMLTCDKYIAVSYEYLPFIYHYIARNGTKKPKSRESFYDTFMSKKREKFEVPKYANPINKDLMDMLGEIND